MLLRLVSATVALSFALATVVLADPPTVSIEQRATLILDGVIVRVDVNCGDGGSSITVLLVGVRQGEFATESLVEFESTGSRQEISVTVPGAFAPGDARASAQLACAGLLSGEQLGAAIKIQ